MTDVLPADPTLDEIRAALAPMIATHAAFDGWTEKAVHSAAEELGIEPSAASLAFSGGALDMIDAWFGDIDDRMAATLAGDGFDGQPVHKKIRAAIAKRLELAEPAKEALRRALGVLAMPQNLPRATRLSWRSADAMWRLAGDSSTDYNHYTKRTILAGVYGSTVLTWLDDTSDGHADSLAFLDRRLGNVAQFEKLKTRLRGDPDRRFSITRFLGRLRYPGR